jgi:DNA-directed RNA polymerase subunit beta'
MAQQVQQDQLQRFVEMLSKSEAIVKSSFPVEGRKHTIRASNFRWKNFGPEVLFDVRQAKEAKLKEKSINADLLADVEIVENETGKVIERKSGHTVLYLPHLTMNSSFIIGGKERQIVNQLRLRPGMYTRFTVDDNVETFLNTTAAGTYKIILDRKTSVLKMRVGTHTHFPIYSVLTATGFNDIEIQQLLGPEVFRINKDASAPDRDIPKLIKKLRPFIEVPNHRDEQITIVASFFASKPLDPEVNKVTVKQAIDKIDKEAFKAAITKILKMSKGEAEPDDTESLAFKSIHSIEDFIPEKLEKAKEAAIRRIKGQLNRKPEIRRVIPPSIFSDPAEAFFTTSEFTRYSSQNNPIDIAAVSATTTVLGEGGISNTHGVTNEIRSVHPSHFGLLDILHSPEGMSTGVTSHLTISAKKKGNTLFMPVYDAQTGERVERSVQDLDDKTIAFPDQYDNIPDGPGSVNGRPKTRKTKVKARAANVIKEVSPRSVDYIFLSPDSFFSSTTAIVPFLNNNDANRVLMADKHIEQSVQLKEPDIPLVQHRIRGKGYEEHFGDAMNPKSRVDGKVMKVQADEIVIKGKDGKKHSHLIHDHFPLNSATFLHDRPRVKVGDKVKTGDTIADNDFTKGNTLSLGKQLNVAYTAYKGYNFEDGIVISEGAAKKLTSVHKYEFRVEKTAATRVGRDVYVAAFPQELESTGSASRYDNNGLPKKGTILNYGDTIIPAVQKVEINPEYQYERLHKSLSRQWKDVAEKWDHDFPGEVIDTASARGFAKVIIKSDEPMQIGDKMSSRHGGKGIVVKILPDNEMYQNEAGEPIDVLFNPAGVPGRVNPGQLFETAAGKIAKKTGEIYYTDNFDREEGESTLAKVQADLKAAGVSDEETITDPTDGHKLKNVLVGDQYFFKLKHSVSGKIKSRSAISEAYGTDEQPSKGGKSSAQLVGILDTFSLLSGDATEFLNDAYGLKSQKNDEYWRALQAGLPTPPPKTPFVEEKFVSMLMGAGINLKQDGAAIRAIPFTDKEILGISNGEISRPTVVKASNMRPEREGLFDPAKTGGIGGSNWTHIKLVEPIVNPLMHDPIVSVARLATKKQLDQIVSGLLAVTEDGEITEIISEGATGGVGVRRLLDKIDVDVEITKTLAETRTFKGDKLNKAFKRLRYLKALKSMEISATDAYTNQVVPVVPPKFRQINLMDDGRLSVADANHGYREVLLVNEKMKQLKELGISDEHMAPLRTALGGAVAGLVGTKAPLTRSKDFKGFIDQVKGSSPKFGFFQAKVQARKQDLSARSTIIPNPSLGIDEIGLPEEMAYAIYKPFVIKRLRESGYKPLDARKMIEDRHPLARRTLEVEAQHRPAIANRAPSLHKFSLQAFKPRIIDGKAIEVNPLIIGGMGADFDGDTVGVHVPVSEAARQETFEKLLPSRNLISPRDNYVMHAPSKETVLGIYLMTTPKGKITKSFKTPAELIVAYHNKEVTVNEAVKVAKKTHCAGQYIFIQAFPKEIKVEAESTNAAKLDAILLVVAKTLDPDKAGEIITAIKDLGNHFVTEVGFSISLKDLEFDYKKRDALLAKAEREVATKGFDKAHTDAHEELMALVADAIDNRFVEAGITSGALGKKNAITRMVAGPFAATDHKSKVIPMTITKSYAEGHDIGSYLATTPGARQGLVDKGISVADTGYFNRMVVNSSIENVISEADCGTTEGIPMDVSSPDALDRYIADGPYKGQLLDSALARKLLGNKITSIVVRSPIECESVSGICQKCFGLAETGAPPRIGFHIGVLAGQTIGERATQLMLRKFHTGGAIGNESMSFDNLRQLIEMPQNIKGKAILAEETGTVTKILPSPTGGWFVYVGLTKHFIPKELGVAVAAGNRVKSGDQLSSSGIVRPQELLDTTGDIQRVRKHLIDELDRGYSSAGQKIKRKLFETVVKPLTDRATVSDPGAAAEMFNVYPGDTVPVNILNKHNKELRGQGLTPITYDPILLGIKQVPLQSQDFVGALVHEKLKATLQKAPQLGLGTNLRTGHPMAQLALTNLRTVEQIKKRPLNASAK